MEGGIGQKWARENKEWEVRQQKEGRGWEGRNRSIACRPPAQCSSAASAAGKGRGLGLQWIEEESCCCEWYAQNKAEHENTTGWRTFLPGRAESSRCFMPAASMPPAYQPCPVPVPLFALFLPKSYVSSHIGRRMPLSVSSQFSVCACQNVKSAKSVPQQLFSACQAKDDSATTPYRCRAHRSSLLPAGILRACPCPCPCHCRENSDGACLRAAHVHCPGRRKGELQARHACSLSPPGMEDKEARRHD